MAYGRGHTRGTRKVRRPKDEAARLAAMGAAIAQQLTDPGRRQALVTQRPK